MSQTTAIRAALEAGDILTPLDALQRFGCFRLAARVRELRAAGLHVLTVPTRTLSGKTVAGYRLAEAQRALPL